MSIASIIFMSVMGVLAFILGHIFGNMKAYYDIAIREEKLKQKFKQDLLEIIKKEEEEKNERN